RNSATRGLWGVCDLNAPLFLWPEIRVLSKSRNNRRKSVNTSSLPVAVIGAGPVGLAAAAHLLSRGERPIVLEAGAEPADNIRQWAHVRTFSAWRENIDSVAREMLERAGWPAPPANEAPTGAEFIDRYL